MTPVCRRFRMWGLLGIVLLAWGIRLWRLDVQDIWWDEARNIDVALRPVGAILTAPELDIHPPGYFLLLHVWLIVAGVSPFTTRFFSLWWGVLLVPLMVLLARRLAIPNAGWAAALYVALAPFLVGEAQETRMYTLAFVLLAGAAWWFWAVWRGRPRAWLGLGAFMAFAVLVHYSTVFVLSAWYVWAVAGIGWLGVKEGRWDGSARRLARDLFRAGVWSLVLFAPQAPRAYRQIAPYGNPNLQVPTLSEYVYQLAQAFTVGLPAAPPWAWAVMVLVGGVLLAGLVWGINVPKYRPALLFLGASVGVPVAAYYGVLIDRATFAPRYISFVVPFFALLVGMGWAALWRWRPVGGIVSLALVAGLTAGIYADQLNPAYFREDTSALATWLMETTGPEDVVFIDVPYPLGFYYPRFSKDPAVVPPDEPSDIAPAYYLFVDVQTIGERLTMLAAGKRRVFWIQWFKSDTDPRGVVTYLLKKYGQWEARHAFRGYQVDVFQVPPDARYEVASEWQAVNVTFAGKVRAVEAALGQAPTPASLADRVVTPRPVWVALRWQRAGEPVAAYKASVRLWNPVGQLIAQDDRRLLNDRHLAPPFWSFQERPMNVYLLELPPGTPPGTYTVTVRVYTPADGQPLSVVGEAPAMAGVDAVIGQVRVARSPAFPEVSPVLLPGAPVALINAELGASQVAPGMVLPVSLLWQAQGASLPELHVRLRLVDAPGRAYSVWTAPPVPWYPTSRWTVGEVVRSLLGWRIAPETPPGRYRAELTLVAPDGTSWGPVVIGQVEILGRARRFEPPPVMYPLQPPPRLDDFAVLVGYDMAGDLQPRARLVITLTWRALGSADVSYTGFVQLLDANNRVLAQEDHVPQRGEAPTTSWLAGEFVQDRYELLLPETLPPGPYRLIAGLYDLRTMRRVPVVNAQGAPVADHVVLRMFSGEAP